MTERSFIGKETIRFIGVVEGRADPMEINRVQVRMYALDTDDLSKTPRESLKWALVQLPTTHSNTSPIHIVEGTTVVGYFLDGEEMQQPIVDGILTGLVREGFDNKKEGFTDPRESMDGQPDNPEKLRLKAGDNIVSGLWRGVGSFINRIKDATRVTGILKGGGGTVDEPSQSYGAKYPFNHGYESESGSGYEFDDTPSKERVHIFHRSGSFIEVHPDGTVVKKSVAGNFNVVLKNNTTIVMGDDIVVVEGSSNVRVNNSASLEVTNGDYNINVKAGNVNLTVNGNVVQKIEGNISYEIGGNVNWTVGGAWVASASSYNWS